MDDLPGRELAAVMFADMVGFTALMQENEQLAIERRTRYRTVLETCHARFGGEIVQHYGDGALSIFHSSVDAVRCAVAIQKELSGPLTVDVRIGLHVGDVIVESGGVLGDAVNIASRIESFGAAGAVLVSDSLHDQVKNQPEFDFVRLGEFNLENVVRPFGIFAVASDGLVVPDVGKLDGKGEVAVPSVGRSEPGGSATKSPIRPRVLAATGALAAVAVVAAVGFGGRLDRSESPVPSSTTDSPAVVPPAVEEPTDDGLEELWSIAVDAPIRGVVTIGGLVVVAAGDGSVSGVAIATGDEEWVHQSSSSLAIEGLFSDERIVYYTTPVGAYVLDPATGEMVGGCGFSFRGEPLDVAVADGSVFFSMFSNGTVRRVTTNPSVEGPCHKPAVESSEAAQWPPPQSGPVVVGSEVLVGDSRRLTRLDVGSLDLVGSYYLASGASETYDGRVLGLAGIELRTQTPTGVRTRMAVYGVDGEGNLHAMAVGATMVPTGQAVATMPLVSELGVYFVDPDGVLRAYSHDLNREYWRVDLPDIPTGSWLTGDTLYVALPDATVMALDIEDGNERHRLEVGAAVVAAAFSDQVVIIADEGGGVTGFLFPSASTPSFHAFEPILTDLPPDPEDVVREFYAAMTAGDKERVSELVAVDAVFGTVFGGGTWFSSKARDEFWALVDFFNALNVELVVGSCEQHAEGMFVRLTCEATQSDDFLGALGVEIDGSALLTVEAGLIDIFRAATGTPFDPNLPAYILTKRRGLSFPVEAENLYENFFDWAAASKPEIAEASCGAGLADRVTVECAAFMLDHVDEYVTESE